MNALLLLALVLGAAPGSSRGAKRAPAPAAARELIRRTVAVTDATREIAVSVSASTATTLAFPQKVKDAFVVDPKGYFGGSLTPRGDFVVLTPTSDIPKGETVSMQVKLGDGTQLPPILFTTAAASVDLFVDFSITLEKRASADSAAALRIQLGEMQSRLDECQQSAGDRGSMKVGELVLKQDFRKPAAFVVEKFPARKLDKQSWLLVETRHVYRLFTESYLVLTVENRDPDKLWVLDRAEIAAAGGSSAVEARVLDVAQQMSAGIPPGEEGTLVVVFKTPEQTTDHQFTLKLFEKAGNRHVSLENLKL